MAKDTTASTSELDREMAQDRRQGYEKFLKFTGVHIVLIVILLALMALFLT
ncbi:MAG: aa3-type cytochrome c oxidase subunit IV [Rhodovibrionaceae bacterium]